MLFSDFVLEDLYNDLEERVDYSLSTACLDPLSISGLYDLVNSFKIKQKNNNFISKEDFLTNLTELKLDYSNKFGLHEFQSALKLKYGSDLKFLSTSGASEAIVLIFTNLFEAGDKIIVQKPIYASLYQIAEDLGVEIIDWHYDCSQDFDFNLDNLRKLYIANPTFKALVINNPNNPTGFFFDNGELEALVGVSKKSGAYLIADEVFKDLVKSELALKSVASLYEKGISIADVSKAYGLQGLRTGWVAIQDEKIRARLLAQKNYFSLRTSILGEYLAAFALENSEATLDPARLKLDSVKNRLFGKALHPDLEKLRQVFYAKLNSFEIKDSNFTYSLNKIFDSASFALNIEKNRLNGLSCFVKFYSKSYSVEDLFKFLLRYKVLLVPGRVYGKGYEEYFRLGLVNLLNL